MDVLNVWLLGCVRVNFDQDSLAVKLTHSTQGLLAYLILFRHRTHPREILTEIFWGNKDPDRSRQSFNTALWQLRNVLEPNGVTRGTYLVSDHHNEIGFNPNSPFWLDVQDFHENSEQIISSQSIDIESCLPQIEKVIALYKGDLLEGFYEDWALRERETVRSHYISTMIYLMDIYQERGEYENSLSYGRKILEMDPLREEIHRKIMRMYLDVGQRVQGLRQYETCKEALFRELNIEPMLETRELYKTLQSAKTGPLLLPKSNSSELLKALNELHRAQAVFKNAADTLDQSIQTLEQLIETQNKGLNTSNMI